MVSDNGGKPAKAQAGLAALPSSVAGIRLVDSEIARLATELSRSVSPPYSPQMMVRRLREGVEFFSFLRERRQPVH